MRRIQVKLHEGIQPLPNKEIIAVGRLGNCPICKNENRLIRNLCDWCKAGRIVVFDHYDPSRLQ